MAAISILLKFLAQKLMNYANGEIVVELDQLSLRVVMACIGFNCFFVCRLSLDKNGKSVFFSLSTEHGRLDTFDSLLSVICRHEFANKQKVELSRD